jgi:hypothetical protein
MGRGRGVGRDRSRLDAVLHPIALAFDDDGLGMVEDAVEDGAGEGGIVVEDARPLLEGLVGAQDNRAALVALADDLKEVKRTRKPATAAA